MGAGGFRRPPGGQGGRGGGEGRGGVALVSPRAERVRWEGGAPPHPARLELRGEDASRFHASMSERMGRELTLAPTAPGPCLRDRDARRASERGSPASEPGLARSGYCGPLPATTTSGERASRLRSRTRGAVLPHGKSENRGGVMRTAIRASLVVGLL